jgi:hypothetical protein
MKIKISNLFSLMLMAASMFLFLGGCRKDEVILPRSYPNAEVQKNSKKVEKVKFEDVLHIWDMVQREIRRTNGSRNTVFKDTDIKKDFVVVFHFSDSAKQTTFRLPTINGEQFNLAVQTEKDVLSNIKIIGFKDFPGSERELTQYSFDSGFGTGGRTESQLIACLKLRFKHRPVRTRWIDPVDYSPGDGKGFNLGEGGNNGGTIRDPWGINWGDGNNVIYTSGSGNTGGNTNNGGNGGNDGGSQGGNNGNCVTLIMYTPFGVILQTFCGPDIRPFHEGNSGSRNSIKECDKLLKELGIIDIGGGIIPDKIDEALEDCRESNPEVQEKINELADGSIKNVCEGTQLDFNPWELEYQLCLTGEYNEEAVDKWLEEEKDGVSYIDDFEIGNNNCPCVNAIWKQIKAKTFSSEFGSSDCSVLEILSDFLEGPLQAEIGISTLNLPDKTNAVAIPNTSNVGNGSELLLFNTRIEINPLLCGGSIDKDPLEIAGMLLHELIHARIYESLYNRGHFAQIVSGPPALNNIWDNFVQSNFPDIIPVGKDQHKLMAQVYVNDLAQALHDLNGGVGDPSDYLIFAWQGVLGAYPEETRHKYDFLPKNMDDLRNNFNNNVKGKGDLQFNGCN